MSDSILSISEFKADASRMLDKIRDEPGSLVLTQNGRARAVVEDYEQHQRQRKALLMLKMMVQGERDIEKGLLALQDEMFDSLRKRLVTDAGMHD